MPAVLSGGAGRSRGGSPDGKTLFSQGIELGNPLLLFRVIAGEFDYFPGGRPNPVKIGQKVFEITKISRKEVVSAPVFGVQDCAAKIGDGLPHLMAVSHQTLIQDQVPGTSIGQESENDNPSESGNKKCVDLCLGADIHRCTCFQQTVPNFGELSNPKSTLCGADPLHRCL